MSKNESGPSVKVEKPSFSTESLKSAPDLKKFAGDYKKWFDTLSKSEQEATADFTMALAVLIKELKGRDEKIAEDKLKSLSDSWAELNSAADDADNDSSLDAVVTDTKKVTFDKEEMTPAELTEFRQQLLEDVKEKLEQAEVAWADANKREENGGAPGFTALQGNLRELKGVVEQLGAGEAVSSKKLEELAQKMRSNRELLIASLDNWHDESSKLKGKEKADTGGGSSKSPDSTPDNVEQKKDDLLNKIEAADEASVAFTPSIEGVYALTKERRKAAVERAYKMYTRNLAEINKSTELSDEDKTKAIDKARALFDEAIRLADPDNSEVIDALKAHQEAVKRHTTAEEVYQAAFKKALSEGKKDVEREDIDKKTNARETLAERIKAEEEAFKMMSALRGINFSEKAVHSGLKTRTFLNEIRNRNAQENAERVNNQSFPRQLWHKLQDGLSGGVRFLGKHNQRLDAKINRINNDKIRKVTKFGKKWGPRVGMVAAAGIGGALTAGALYGALAAAPVALRIGGGMLGAAGMGKYSLMREKSAIKDKTESWTSLREKGEDSLEQTAEKVVKAEKTILSRQKNRPLLMFLGGMAGGGLTSVAYEEITEAFDCGGDNIQTPESKDEPSNASKDYVGQHIDNNQAEEYAPPEEAGADSANEDVECLSALVEQLDATVSKVAQLQEHNAALTEAVIAHGAMHAETVEAAPVAPEVGPVVVEPPVTETLSLDTFKALETDAKVKLPHDGDYSLWNIAEGDLADGSKGSVIIEQPEAFAMAAENGKLQQLIAEVVKEIERNPEAREALGMKVSNNPNEWLHAGREFNTDAYDRLAKIVGVRCNILPADVLEYTVSEVKPIVVEPIVPIEDALPTSDNNVPKDVVGEDAVESTNNDSDLSYTDTTTSSAPDDGSSQYQEKNRPLQNNIAPEEAIVNEKTARVHDDGSRQGQEQNRSVYESGTLEQAVDNKKTVDAYDDGSRLQSVIDKDASRAPHQIDPGASPEHTNNETLEAGDAQAAKSAVSPELAEARESKKLRFENETGKFVPIEEAEINKNPLVKGVREKFTIPDPAQQESMTALETMIAEGYVTEQLQRSYNRLPLETQAKVLSELNERATAYELAEKPDSENQISQLFDTIVRREEIVTSVGTYFENTVENFEASEFQKLLSERTSEVLEQEDSMPDQVSEFITTLNGQGILKTGYSLLESLEEAIQNGLLTLKDNALDIIKRGVIMDHTETFRVGPQ